MLQKKTGQCFGLNGVIFLGSILLWDYGLAPGMAWLLAGAFSTSMHVHVLDSLFCTAS